MIFFEGMSWDIVNDKLAKASRERNFLKKIE